MDHVNGIDVSDWQGDVAWNTVLSDGYSFAYAKATQSNNWTAGTFATNYAGVKAANMLAGAYHMFDFTVDPTAQARYFLSVYEPVSGDLPPAVDLELPTPNGPRDAVARIAQFLSVVEAACSGRHALVYVNYNFWQNNLASTDGFAGQK